MENKEQLFTSRVLTEPQGFTSGIEGPGCDAQGILYAVNYAEQGTIGRVTPKGDCSVFLNMPGTSIGNGIRFTRAGEMLIADYVNHNVWKVDMATKAMTVLGHSPDMNQPNDIAITATDIVLASDPNWGNNTGNIWRITPDGTVTLLESNMGTTNGIEVSADEKTLYVNESVQRRIWAYDLSADGSVSNKRLFIEFPDFGLDGMRCDAQGNVYCTRFGKGTIVKISPAGKILKEIQLHGKNCTNLTFGGRDGRTVYVTVADNGNIETFRVDIPGRDRVLCGAVTL
ncbi:SMP-30/gluconolactonase/LRE family protein [Paenibacillus lutrae]|uniref:SMP-30/gluconolactonase/LRE family protein n=1 Tax=Paenibacillus lutrae TaxID=2078573 RepID=A0A7X3FID6_9BACL|nr:SMP-30/gluconolactonase/LRE family protein [Paenibacillus lutrae]MVP00210.1 SMP-30/gluconolactonase/LRE family protein [Paenibacillus lutrae]